MVNSNTGMAKGTAMRLAGLVVLLAVLVSACGKDSTGPVLDRALVTGSYNMTALAFDPQGSLAEVNVLAGLGAQPQLILSSTGSAQIVYQDPTTNLFTTIAGTFSTTENGARIQFSSNAPYATLLLSRRMDFVFDSLASTLTFDGAAPDGVNRARLIELAPQYANEQLLSPVPGNLRVIFKGS